MIFFLNLFIESDESCDYCLTNKTTWIYDVEDIEKTNKLKIYE